MEQDLDSRTAGRATPHQDMSRHGDADGLLVAGLCCSADQTCDAVRLPRLRVTCPAAEDDHPRDEPPQGRAVTRASPPRPHVTPLASGTLRMAGWQRSSGAWNLSSRARPFRPRPRSTCPSSSSSHGCQSQVSLLTGCQGDVEARQGPRAQPARAAMSDKSELEQAMSMLQERLKGPKAVRWGEATEREIPESLRDGQGQQRMGAPENSAFDDILREALRSRSKDSESARRGREGQGYEGG
eukprot:187651-Hanusia_phi.AAC.1